MDDGRRVLVTLNVDKTLPLYQSTTATIRYQDLIGNRYVNLERGTGEGADRCCPPGLHPDVAHPARPRPRRPDRRVQAAVQGAGSGEGQQHRVLVGDGVPGPGRHDQRHPGPDRAADLRAGRPGPGHRPGDHQPEHRAGHHRQASEGVRPDGQQLRDPHHRAEEPRRPAGRRDRRHQQRLRHARRPAARRPAAAEGHHRLSRDHPAAPRRRPGPARRPPDQAAAGDQDDRPRGRYLRRLLQLLPVRHQPEAQRPAAGRPVRTVKITQQPTGRCTPQ